MADLPREPWQRDPMAGVLALGVVVLFGSFAALGLALAFAPTFVQADLAVSAAIRSLRWPWLEPVSRVATWIGDLGPMAFLTLATGAALWMKGRRTSGATIVLTVSFGSLLGSGLKVLFGRGRPALDVARVELPATYSFPSGHALSSVLFFGTVAFLIVLHSRDLRKAIAGAVLCLLAAAAISMARVYLGVHYFGDVVGSWLLGMGLLAVMVLVSARWGASSGDKDFK